MIRKVIVDVPEYNRYIVTVEGKDIDEIKKIASTVVYEQESERDQVAVKSVSGVEPYVHPIEEEEFFYDPKKKEIPKEDEIPLGIGERFGGYSCEECSPYDLDNEEPPENWDYIYEEFKCNTCGRWIVY